MLSALVLACIDDASCWTLVLMVTVVVTVQMVNLVVTVTGDWMEEWGWWVRVTSESEMDRWESVCCVGLC